MYYFPRNILGFVYFYFIWLLILSMNCESDTSKTGGKSGDNISEANNIHEIEDHIFYEYIPKHPSRDKHRSEIRNPSVEAERIKFSEKEIREDRETIKNIEDSGDLEKKGSHENLDHENDSNHIYRNEEEFEDFDNLNRDMYNRISEMDADEDSPKNFESFINNPDEGITNDREYHNVNNIQRNQKIYRRSQGKYNEGGIPGGMHGGMHRGMQGGMQGGMPGGMHGGMQGGMQGGMHGGMPGGMHGGIPGGMHGGRGHYGGHNHRGMNNYQTISEGDTNNTSKSFGFLGGIFNSAYEIMMFVFIGGFIYNCFFGKTHNDKFAQAWYNVNKEYFEKRYETVGYTDMKNPDQEEEIKPSNCNMIKENPYLYKLVCTNYRYIKALFVLLEFRKRPDAVSMLTSFLVNTKDRIIYQVAIDPIEDVSWMFCISKKRDANSLKHSYPDINFFGKQHDPSVFGEKLTVITENLELFVELFQNKNLLSFFKSIESYIDLIYYTDQQTFCKDKHSLFFSFELHLNKTLGHENYLLEITHFVNLFSDTLAQLKYNENVKKDFEKNRIMFERSKMEEAMRKEIEEKEKRDFIEQWKIKNKNKYKKIGQKKNKDKKEKK